MQKSLPLYGAFITALLLSLLCYSTAFSQATVTSDKPDYAPRSTAIFTGEGFAPFETVQLKVKNLSYPCNTVFADSSYLPWTVVADENGGFVTEWLVCDCPGDSLRLKATGLTSLLVAYAYFTDAGNASSGDGSITPSPSSACSGSSSNTFGFTFTSPSGKDFIAGSQLQVTVPATWTSPTTTSGSPGFVSVAASSGSAGTGVSVSIQSVAGNIITINMTAPAGKSFVLTYANVPAPAAATYTFSSSSKISGGSFVALASNNQPKITVNPAPSATISYTASPYCSTAGNIDVTRTGTSGGTYSSTAGLSINSSSGRISAGSSTPGTYTVTYKIAAANGCSEFTTTTSVTINAAPSATFSYAGTPYCANAGTASPTFSGTTGGTFTSTSGLSIDGSSGDVDLAASTPGLYTVTYTVAASGGCSQFQTTAQIRVTVAPSATISYDGSPYCASANMVDVTFTGTTGGSFSGDAGLVINSGSGRVNTGTSTPGTHTVTYTVAASNGCSQYQTTASITIYATPKATLSGTTSICSGGTATLLITTSVGTGTFSGTLSDGTAFSGTGSSFTVDVSPTTNTTYTIATLQDDNCTAVPSGRMGSATVSINTAPVVTTDPTNQTECVGSTVTFTAAASGSPTPTVQWQVKSPGGTFSNIDGETSTTLTFTADATQNGNVYRAVFTNTCSSTNSAEASLTVNTAPVVTADPTNQTECVGSTVTFTAAASGSPTPTVQWQVKTPGGSFSNIDGETSTTLTFTADATQNGNVYRAVYTNTCSSTNSAEASLTVNTAPLVTTDPINQTECVGSTVTFTAAASGSPTPTVQWQVKTPGGSFSNIDGETSTTLTFTADATQNGNVYRAVFTNTCSSTNSAEAGLTVNTAPSIIGHPASSLKCIGESATFTVVATGTGLTYKWYKSGSATALVDGGKISNATTNSLTISNITTAEAGNYYVVVSGTCNPSATSNVGKLMVKEVVVSPTGAQYSDQVKFTAKIYNGKDLLTYSPTVTFKVSSINLDGGVNIAMALDGATENIKAEVTRPLVEVPGNPSNGQMSPGAKTVLACFNNITSPASTCNAQTTLNIYREDAKVEYTGTQFITTGSSSEGNATVQLRATVQDITAVTGDPLYDAFNGDIRNARVMFVNRDASNAAISGWLTPTLINTSDVKTGTVSYNVSLAAGTTATDYTIGVVVGYNVVSSPADSMGYYKRNNGDDDIVLTVSRPLNEFITGGGYIVPSTPNGSSGLKASDAGRKVNFGFNVKYTKSNKNLQGRINVIFRRTESDGIRHVYQVKSTSLTSLAIDQTKLIANVVAKGNVVDITNPLMPVSVPGCPGNLTMNFNVVDKGEPGSLDSMSLTLWDNNKLIYATSWSGTKTLYKVLTGGNIQVRGASYVASTSVVDEATRDMGMDNTTLFKVKAYPNPSTHQFTLDVESGSNEQIEVKVFDVAGYMVYYHRGSLKEAHHRFGQMLTNGTYFLDVRQGDKRSTITLLKK